MLVLGLILIVLAALAFIVVIVAGSNDSSTLAMGSSFHWTPSTMTMFLAGAVTLLVMVVGIDLLRTALRRAHQRRKDAKELDRLAAKVEQHEAEKREQEAAAPETRADTRSETRETREL